MELRHLRYFVAVATELGFGRAALKLGISQPPLSQQIQALEAELDVQLIDRSSRQIRLTPAGVAFKAEAERLLAQADRARDTARQAASGRIGRLAIGFTPSVPFIAPFSRSIRGYCREFPDVAVRVVEAISREQVLALADEQLDVGFIRSPLPLLPPGISVVPVFRDRLTLIARHDHRFAAMEVVPVAELRGEPMIIMDRKAGTGLHGHVNALLAAHGFGPTVAQEVGGAWTPLSLVAAGLGVAILYSSLIAHLRIDEVVERPIADVESDCEVLLAYSAQATTPARNFIARVVAGLDREAPPGPV